jgi:lysophospholipase L1-like esterase
MKNHLLKKSCFAALTLLFSIIPAHRASAFEVQWPQPTPPAGTNTATFPLPRLDWLGHFLKNIDMSKGKTVDLIFDGDSITDFWMGRGAATWAERYAPLNAFDFGISGDQTQHLLWRLQNGQVDGLNPKLIVLMIGTNNMPGNSCTSDQIVEGDKAIIAEYEKRCPGAHILLLGIFPRGELASNPLRAKITAANAGLAKFDDGKTVTYLDIGSKFLTSDGTLTKEIFPDALHPSPQGYVIWADAIQSVVDKYCPKPTAPATK